MSIRTQEPEHRVNGINLDVIQQTVDSIKQDPELGACRFRATNKWIDANHNCTTVTGFYGAKQQIQHQHAFELHADEPPLLAGQDQSANPVEHLLNALASCCTTSMVAHAAVRGIEIQELESEVEGDIDLRGFLGLDNAVPKGLTDIRIKFKVKCDQASVKQLKELAAYSPIYNTLIQGVPVEIEITGK